MLPSLLRPRHPPLELSNIFSPCLICQSRCGRLIWNREPTIHPQRRRIREIAPSLRNRKNYDPVTPAEKKEYKIQEQRAAAEQTDRVLGDVQVRLEHLRNRGFLDVKVEHAMGLLRTVPLLPDGWMAADARKREQNFRPMAKAKPDDISDIDLASIAWSHLMVEQYPWIQKLGLEMMLYFSFSGNEYASLYMMGAVYRRAQDRPGELQNIQFRRAKKHVFEIANRGDNQNAMVLAGKIAYASDKREWEYAVRLWTDALEAPPMFDSTSSRKVHPVFQALVDSTSSPYNDLTLMYIERGKFDMAEDTIEIGCNQDDPISHYYAALRDKTFNTKSEDNELGQKQLVHKPTSTWLYHISKAAASGYPRAMHELGCYYVKSYWPYLTDEPPDAVKPTPFDRYPPEHGRTEPALTSSWSRAMAAISLGIKIGDAEGEPALEDPRLSAFQNAVVPHDVEGRLKMALAWLELAQNVMYAPSFLAAAQIYLTKEVWPDLAVPAEALQLRESRHKYANKSEYDAASSSEDALDIKKIPNPVFDNSPKEDNKAYGLIQGVFTAAEAANRRHRWVVARQKGSEKRNFAQLLGSMPINNAVWFQHPDFYPLFMNEADGTLFDDQFDAKNPSLLDSAKRICDEQQWDVYDPDDYSLLYRHRGKR